jgi:uncharacterized protein YdeI (YjbR/CyaY-like superfamily)
MATAERVEAKDRATWRRWLRRNHTRPSGVWVVITRKGRGAGLSLGEAVEEALCFGWIDSKPNKLDDDRFLLWIAPRKPKSVWSAINKRRIDELIASGRMTDAGLAAVEVAKRNGSWAALEEIDALILPEDLAAALDATPKAKAHFEAFPPSSKRIILEWIRTAKREETRAKRIAETVRLAADNVRANHWRQ